MSKPLHILIVEDSASDAGLVARLIEQAGYELRWERVDDAAGLKTALETQSWDVILCDYRMPDFSGTHALAIVCASECDVPFIFVSGTIGEEAAVEAMKSGAQDYVVKGNLKRLVPAIERELREAEGRRQRRRAEEELRFRNAILSTQLEASIDGILVVGEDAKVVSHNSRLVEMWQIPPALLATRDGAALLRYVASKLADPAAFLQRVQYLCEHRRETSREELVLKDGRVLDRYSAPMFGADEHYYGRVWYFRDMTDHRRLESQLRQAQKMEAIGQLAGGVAHDFNNILSAIMMHAELSGAIENVPAEARENIRQIRACAERAANLTRQLLLFSRRQVMQPRDLDLNEVVTDLAKMLQRIIGEDVQLHLQLHPTPLITRADAGMLDQLLMNLTVNARDAMPEGGRLSIETATRTVDEDLARIYPDAAPGRYVWLSVSDTGYGIPPEVLPRIFEPFFTTKDPGKGTGLGLATVFGIVRQHHGWIKVYSEPGQGANFQVFLPASNVSHD